MIAIEHSPPLLLIFNIFLFRRAMQQYSTTTNVTVNRTHNTNFIQLIICRNQGLKWDSTECTGIPVLLWSAWNHIATSFWSTTIPVCCRMLNSCKIYCSLCSARNSVSSLSGKSLNLLCQNVFPRSKICEKCICGRGSAPDPNRGAYRGAYSATPAS